MVELHNDKGIIRFDLSEEDVIGIFWSERTDLDDLFLDEINHFKKNLDLVNLNTKGKPLSINYRLKGDTSPIVMFYRKGKMSDFLKFQNLFLGIPHLLGINGFEIGKICLGLDMSPANLGSVVDLFNYITGQD